MDVTDNQSNTAENDAVPSEPRPVESPCCSSVRSVDDNLCMENSIQYEGGPVGGTSHTSDDNDTRDGNELAAPRSDSGHEAKWKLNLDASGSSTSDSDGSENGDTFGLLPTAEGRGTTAEVGVTTAEVGVTTADGVVTTADGVTAAEEVTAADGRVTTADGGITTAEEGLNSAEGGLSSAEGGLSSAGGGLSSADGGLSSAEGGLSSAEGGLSSAEGGLSTAECALSTAEGGLSTAEGGLSTAEVGLSTTESGLTEDGLTEVGHTTSEGGLISADVRDASPEKDTKTSSETVTQTSESFKVCCTKTLQGSELCTRGGGDGDAEDVLEILMLPSDEEDFLGFDVDSSQSKSDLVLMNKLQGTFSCSPVVSEDERSDISGYTTSSTHMGFPSLKKKHALRKDSPSPRSRRVDISSPLYRKPFEYGWKRELVFRSSDSPLKRMADIYYYTPLGRKVRSNREVAEYLSPSSDLTIENFTFAKEPLGIDDPEKEIIRDAKKIIMKESTKFVSKSPAKKPVQKPVREKETEIEVQSQAPDAESKQVHAETTADTTPVIIAKPAVKTSIPRGFPKIKVTPIRKQKAGNLTRQKRKSSDDGDLEMGMLPPMWASDTPVVTYSNKKTASTAEDSSSSSGTTTTTKAPSAGWTGYSPDGGCKKSDEPCSIRCVGVMGLIPSLQCRLCLCLYHPECVGLGPITETIHSYVCKNCQKDVKEGKASLGMPTKFHQAPKMMSNFPPPPPLTPISELIARRNLRLSLAGSQSASTPIPPPPKLQKMVRSGEPNKIATYPRLVRVPREPPPQNLNIGTVNSIVGSVTTWLPPSSTIQLSSLNSSLASSDTTAAVVIDSGKPNISNTTSMEQVYSTGHSVVQTLACMRGKRYIIVPKQNVVSVSPSLAAAATTPTSKANVNMCEPTNVGEKPPASVDSGVAVTSTTEHTNMAGQPQLLLASNQIQPFSSGSPINTVAPKSTAYIVGTSTSGHQNPPGVLLVPFMGSTTFTSTTVAQDITGAKSSNQSQYVVVNSTSSAGFDGNNIILSGLPQQGMLSLDQFPNSQTTVTSQKRTGPESDSVAWKQLKLNSHQDLYRRFMDNYITNVSTGYSALLQIFQYLKVQDLLRASRVNRMWRDMAGHHSLWKTVRMKNSHVSDWEGFAGALSRHGTQHLDMRKMLIPSDEEPMWDVFASTISSVRTLIGLDLCRCPAKVVENLPITCPQLKIINAMTIRDPVITLEPLKNLHDLHELRLKSVAGITLVKDLQPLARFPNMKHLSLTTIKAFGQAGIEVIGSLVNLESLELGECCDFPAEFGTEVLPKLTKLEKLRLEKGQGKHCPVISLLTGAKASPVLTQLELVNFEVKPGFDAALSELKNIKKLLIIPSYLTQSATTNHMVLAGVLQLHESLTHLVWGVTIELLKVTELFVDQVEGLQDLTSPMHKKYGITDSIPVLKPVLGTPEMGYDEISSCTEKPGSSASENLTNLSENITGNPSEIESSAVDSKGRYDLGTIPGGNPHVEILPVPQLERIIATSLPNTKVKILRTPFHATWRQTLSEISLP